MLSKKAKNITPSLTIGISTKVKELIDQGLDIINLSIGEPNFCTPTPAKEAAVESIYTNKAKYGPASGITELRKTIIHKLKTENNISYQLDEIVVSSGAKHAITNALIALINPGDEVLIPKPYWVSYPEMIKLVGGNPVFLDTKMKNNFKMTTEDIIDVITPKTKMIFITNPSNPTGAVYSKEELKSIVNLCIQHNIFILADEIYERICYKDNFISIASLSEKAKNITITINGLSKSAAMTGWRIGYTAANQTISKAISAIQGHLTSHPCVISQYGAIKALNSCQEDIQTMVLNYKKKRDIALNMLEKIKDISFIKPNGAFYVFIDISSLKNKLKYNDYFSISFANQLLEQEKVAVVPGVAFGMDDFIRISYACDNDTLIEGIKRISSFINNL
ncbi:pyridoxal phosphate-dependent aminotransferase [Lutibacter sp. B2]|nr:pyridoxal phosphate-dependent aminotransferase [Lutibacter sp. B2]